MRKIPRSTISTLLPISKNASKSQPLRRVTTSVFVSCLPRYMGAGTGRGRGRRDAERPRPDERDCCSFGKAAAGGPTSGPRPGLAAPTGPLLQPLRRGELSGQSFVLWPPGRRLQTFRSQRTPAGLPLPTNFS